MTDTLKAYDPDDWTMRDEPFRDPERDQKPGLDVTGLSMDGARQTSRHCPHCDGEGLATVFDPEYDSSATIDYSLADGTVRTRLARTTAYCECNLGRKIMTIHQCDCKDVYARTKDFCDIKGKPSYWLEFDPSLPRDSRPIMSHVGRAQMFRSMIGTRITHDKTKEQRECHDQIHEDRPD